MPNKSLKEFLDNHHVHYRSLQHAPGFTAQEVAAAAHVSGKQLAKTVIVKIGNQFAMIVLPANQQIDLASLQHVTGEDVRLAQESEFRNCFPECEVGAMSPFGNLYNMPVYVANELSHYHQMTFNAGSHSELITLAYRDFERLVHPKVVKMH